MKAAGIFPKKRQILEEFCSGGYGVDGIAIMVEAFLLIIAIEQPQMFGQSLLKTVETWEEQAV